MERHVRLARTTPLRSTSTLQRGGELSRARFRVVPADATVVPLRATRTRRETGFSAAVKVKVRYRAGAGDAADARCEACGVHLGRTGGQVQHRRARGMGGSSSPVIDSIVNAALLCGTPLTGCHGRAERRDRDMLAEGFWLENGQDPAETPILLHASEQSGLWVWLGADGSYVYEMPDGGSAA